MATRLPTKLQKEPLIDAIFEIRFTSKTPASVVLPGVFFEKLPGEKTIDALPIAQIPKAMRDADPNLKIAALSRITLSNVFINVSDHSISVSCKYPYLGWKQFRAAINRAISILSESNLVETVERYSLKYVDILQDLDDHKRVSAFNVNISLAGHTLEKEPYQLRIEVPKDGFVHVIQLISSARAVLHNGILREGVVVDVDTIASVNGISIMELRKKFLHKLDAIHEKNKAMFFDCLTSETISFLEPIYE